MSRGRRSWGWGREGGREFSLQAEKKEPCLFRWTESGIFPFVETRNLAGLVRPSFIFNFQSITCVTSPAHVCIVHARARLLLYQYSRYSSRANETIPSFRPSWLGACDTPYLMRPPTPTRQPPPRKKRKKKKKNQSSPQSVMGICKVVRFSVNERYNR